MRHYHRYNGIEICKKYYHFPQCTNILGSKYKWLVSMFYIEENNRYDRKLVKNPIEGIGLLFEGENTSLAAWIEFGHLVSFLWLLPQHWLFKKTETYCFMILEDGSPTPRYWLGHTSSEGSGICVGSFNLWSLQIFGWWPRNLNSVFTWPSPLISSFSWTSNKVIVFCYRVYPRWSHLKIINSISKDPFLTK